jgi:hypothetical protein
VPVYDPWVLHARARTTHAATGARGDFWAYLGACATVAAAAVSCAGPSSTASVADGGAAVEHPAADAVLACSSDSVCGGLRPRCDLATSRCVPCAGADCIGGSVCDPSSGTCVDCLADVDCGAPTSRCDPARHLCVAPCRTAGDCVTPGSSLCDAVRASCAECATDANCRGGQRCDPGTAACVDCLVDAHCPRETPVCTPGHTCSDACVTDIDCGAGSPGGGGFCDPRSHLCADCLKNGDCGMDGYCRKDGTCA